MSAPNDQAVPLTVTAIIPTFNRAQYLGAAIESLLAQSRSPDQIIVVNDGSTDATEDVIASFGEAIEPISKINGGKSSALNLALKHARGSAIWIFDDDDIAAPDALESLAGALESAPQAGFSYGLYTKFRTDIPDPKAQAFNDYQVAPEDLHIQLLEHNFIMQPGMLVRRHCYQESGEFNSQLIRSQDYEMLLRLSRRFSGVAVRKIVFHQRKHEGVRGSLNAPVKPVEIWKVWSRYDRAIFGKIHGDYSLAEFLPSGLQMTDELRCIALIRRACIMGRKGLWELAGDDFTQAAAAINSTGRNHLSIEETEIIRRVFDGSNLDLGSVAESRVFRDSLARISSKKLRHEIRVALLWHFLFHLRRNVASGDFAKAATVFSAYVAVATTLSAASSLIGKMRSRLFKRHHGNSNDLMVSR